MLRRHTPWPGAIALALALSLSLAAPAGATVYEVFTVTSLQFLGLGGAEVSAQDFGLATIHTSGSGSDHLSSLTLPALSLVESTPVTGAGSVTSFRVDLRRRPDLQGGTIGNVSGAVGSSAGGLSPNTIAATGGFTVCLLISPLPPCAAQLALSLGVTSPSGAYLGSGVGGVQTLAGSGTLHISLVGAPYTVKTVTGAARTGNGGYDVKTARGFAHGPASLTSSTAVSGGILQLVTATRIPVGGGGGSDLIGTISTLRVALIPEPGLLAGLAAGAALVALLGLRSRRR